MWLALSENDFHAGSAFIDWISTERAEHDKFWLPSPLEIVRSVWLADHNHSPDYITLAQRIVLWIETARAAGYDNPKEDPSSWLPTTSDLIKSALFERLRHGIPPLAEPPPLGYSCPWYAVVEDQGPHWVGMHDEVTQSVHDGMLLINVQQTRFQIVDTHGEKNYTVADVRHKTSYRFRLWFDPKWSHPSGYLPDASKPGGWMIRSRAFDNHMIQD